MIDEIKTKLEQLKSIDFCESAGIHKFDRPLSVEMVEQFEQKNNVQLPKDYKEFITQIGNGLKTDYAWKGAIGPGNGIVPLYFDESFNCYFYKKTNLINIANPFPYKEEFNLPNREELQIENIKWADKYNDQFYDKAPTEQEYEEFIKTNGKSPEYIYYDKLHLTGVIPIGEVISGIYYFLIINSELKGEVWLDERAFLGGFRPEKDIRRERYGERLTFGQWYLNWLNKTLDSFSITKEKMYAKPSFEELSSWGAAKFSDSFFPILSSLLKHPCNGDDYLSASIELKIIYNKWKEEIN